MIENLHKTFQNLIEFGNSRKKACQEILNLITKRINAEIEYSKSLQNISTTPINIPTGYFLIKY